MRVLVIDDEEPVRALFRTVLEQAGFLVSVAGNGREGMAEVTRQPVDVVVTDVLMPEVEGVETISMLRALRPELGVIAVSGGGRTRNLRPLQVARECGADLALAKPVEPQDLLGAVAKVLQRRSA